MQQGPTRLAGSGCPSTNSGQHVLETRHFTRHSGEKHFYERCRQCGEGPFYKACCSEPGCKNETLLVDEGEYGDEGPGLPVMCLSENGWAYVEVEGDPNAASEKILCPQHGGRK